ncbi:hypothetical protein N7510_001600 [Penicillium lagena]|uniref:uncharacterized protein n=1 Tax=Penicillium lagena TaxID=94218 RepID=UPI0025409111|nr:uncharacterized protein N7510_001600 [Penicillium lagena]KAJ5625291.1 hypothetical protein N7510_001600 [Penicillium lagena]
MNFPVVGVSPQAALCRYVWLWVPSGSTNARHLSDQITASGTSKVLEPDTSKFWQPPELRIMPVSQPAVSTLAKWATAVYPDRLSGVVSAVTHPMWLP